MPDNEYQSVVRPILKWIAAQRDCKAINIHGSVYMERGTPDIIGCCRGRMFLFECKATKGKLRPDQRVRIRQWRESGAIAEEIRTLEEAQSIIDKIRSSI